MSVTPANVISSGTATAASSYAPNFTASAAIGDSLMVGVMITGGTATIASIADSKGNTWTIIDHHSGGSGNDAVVAYCNVTVALTTSDTFTVTSAGGNFSTATVRADLYAGVTYAPVGTPTISAEASTQPQTASCTTTAAQDCWVWFSIFLASASTPSVSSTFTKTSGSFVTTTGSNSAESGYLAASGAALQSFSCNWGSAHTGMGFATVLAVSGAVAVNTTDTAAATSSSALAAAKDTTESGALTDITNDITIDDGVADVTFTDSASLGNTPFDRADAVVFTDSSGAIENDAATVDSAAFTDLSQVTVLGTSPTSGELFTFTDTAALAISNEIQSVDAFTVDDIAFAIQAGFPYPGLSVVTIIGPHGKSTIESETV